MKEELKLLVELHAVGWEVMYARILAAGRAFVCSSRDHDPALVLCDTQRAAVVFRGHENSVLSVDKHPSRAFAAEAWTRAHPRDVARVSHNALSRLPPSFATNLSPEAFAALPRAQRAGAARALADEPGERVRGFHRRSLARLPLGVLHALPPESRDACLARMGWEWLGSGGAGVCACGERL